MKVFFKLGIAFVLSLGAMQLISSATEDRTDRRPAAAPAPAGFDNLSNGLVSQTMLEADRELFEDRETIEDGLGPVYNAVSCADCHQNPVIGGPSQITELRAGQFSRGMFVEHPGGSLIQDRAIDPAIQERVLDDYDVRSLRISLNTLGDGFIEAIDDSTLISISQGQPPGMRGEVIRVPVLEANGALRVGRFGWKNQHASLESFAADAYLNEMGITSPLKPFENTSIGNAVNNYDSVADPEDDGADVRAFARFIRATKVPPRDENLANTADAKGGAQIFTKIGCETCHVGSIVTAPEGTMINGGAFVLPQALGNKLIHPFSDFLLHDVGTGDGIVQNGGPSTANKMRTPPLWGLRTHSRLMHDGQSLTLTDAILRHKGEATTSVGAFRSLSRSEIQQLLLFLNSL
jgi:CxxC motif-containing protein (DUF1111 family)